jgi:hypothetical protein
MTGSERLFSFSLKHGLFLIAVIFATAAAILIIFFSSAATLTGSSPDLAITMAPGSNTGVLGPGEYRWFKLTPDRSGAKYQNLNLNMSFTSAAGYPDRAVNFELFVGDEVMAWQRGERSNLSNFGAGMPLSGHGDPAVGERVWQGTVLRDGSYYLAVKNVSNARIDYWLVDQNARTDGVMTTQLPPAQPAEAASGVAAIAPVSIAPVPPPSTEAAPAPVIVPAAPVAPPAIDADGQSPLAAVPLRAERYKGHLTPGQEAWYSFSVDNTGGQFEETALTMVFTPDDGNRIHYVTMDIYPAEGVQNWSSQSRAGLVNVGAGSIVYRDDNAFTGERFWSGWVVNNKLYYVRIANGSDAPVDFWLFTGDVYRPSLD